ncbi:ABC transporter permease [Microbacterium sp. 18062]|uniref:ABC transporter permease n=1 Tax=Microbacterium sp. 18062 TaxID=2681410 RepID=UPI0013583C13|nr:ABC transporter permease [Microbacterium sp. 18062]
MTRRRLHRLTVADLVRTAWLGVAGRPQRTVLAALGIALGIASLVALTGASASNRAQLLAELDAMGADLAVVAPGSGPDQQPVPLPDTAPEGIARQDGVERIGVFETAPEGLAVYRTDLVPATETNGLNVAVARPDVLAAIEGELASGRWFDDAARNLPVTVLGATAAERLGVDRAGDRVLIGGEWYGVLGVLESAGLATDIDTAAILGDAWTREHFAGDAIGDIASIYVRAEPGAIGAVRDILAAAASPGSPYVAVTRLSDLAEARATTDDSLVTLGIALAGIALLVGGVGIANTMVVTVLERRGEIGLRRALGARPGQIAAQFIAEAVVLSLIGGLAGVGIGAVAAAVMAGVTGQPVVIPLGALAIGPALSLLVGVVAGLQPATRAARLAPTTALRNV